jgi:hypothetical protein
MLYQERDIPCYVYWLILSYLEHKCCTHIGRIDEKSMRYQGCCSWVSSFWAFPSTFDSSAHLKSQRRYHEVSASIARVWHILCSEYPSYHGSYWQTDWQWTLPNKVTSKLIPLLNRHSSQILLERLAESEYAMNNPIDFPPFEWQALPQVTFNPLVQWQGQPIPFVMHQKNDIFRSVLQEGSRLQCQIALLSYLPLGGELV